MCEKEGMKKKQLEKCRLRHQATHRDTSSALVTVDSHPSRYLDEKVKVHDQSITEILNNLSSFRGILLVTIANCARLQVGTSEMFNVIQVSFCFLNLLAPLSIQMVIMSLQIL